MSEKIGKWYLIFSAISCVLLVLYGFLQKGILPPLQVEEIPFYALLAVPFASALLCLLLAWIISTQKKKAKTEEQPAKSDNTMSVFFKSYLYLWTIVALAIAGMGMMFYGHIAADPNSDILVAMVAMSVAWIGTVIVCILIWAAFNAWKSNEVVGVIVGLVSIILLALTGLGTAYLYNEICSTRNDYYSDYNGEYAEPQVTEEGEDGDDYASATPVYEGSELYENAFIFMIKCRLKLNNTSYPVELLRNWKLYDWHAEGYEPDYAEDMPDYSKFEACSDCFYYVYDHYSADAQELTNLCDYYTNNMSQKLTSSTYKKSGAKNLVKILQIAYNDIYSHESPGTILSEIYDIMNDDDVPEEYSDDIVVSYRYPKIYPYISVEAGAQIADNAGSDPTDWEKQLLSAWAYSFWARRYHDGVDDTASKILKTIDKLYNK